MYRLIAQQTPGSPTPYYSYFIQDAEGNNVSGVTKAVITIDAEHAIYPKMTMHRKWVGEDNKIQEEVIENVDVDIQTRT